MYGVFSCVPRVKLAITTVYLYASFLTGGYNTGDTTSLESLLTTGIAGGLGGSGSGHDHAHLNRILEMMAEKQKEDDKINEILKDWKILAQKVDYFLFWIFLTITSFTSFLFIFFLPYYNRGKLL